MSENQKRPESQEKFISGHTHSFDTGIATALGLHAAIVFNHIVYWLRINAKKKDANIIDGKIWMYETQKEMADFFGYLSLDDIKKAMAKLLRSGLLIKGNFNNNPFDKTNWYTTDDQSLLDSKNTIQKILTKVPNGTIGSAIRHDPPSPTAPCIYDNKNTTTDKDIVCAPVAPDNNFVPVEEKKVAPEEKLPAYEKITKQGFLGKTHSLCKNDIIEHAIQTRKDWTVMDIEESWKVLVAYSDPIRDIFKFVEGTIINNKKLAGLKSYEEKIENTYRTQSNGPTSSQKEKTKGYNLINGKPPTELTEEEKAAVLKIFPKSY